MRKVQQPRTSISEQEDVGREDIKEMPTRAGALNTVSVPVRLNSSEHYSRKGERFLATLIKGYADKRPFLRSTYT